MHSSVPVGAYMVTAAIVHQALVDVGACVIGLLHISRMTLTDRHVVGVEETSVVALGLLNGGAGLPACLSGREALWQPAYPPVFGAVQLFCCRVEKVTFLTLVGHFRVELPRHCWISNPVVISPAKERLTNYVVSFEKMVNKRSLSCKGFAGEIFA